MGYVRQTIPSYSSTGIKSALLYSFDGGVNYSTDGLMVSDSQATSCKNMWLKNGIIMSRPEFSACENGVFEGEKLNSSYYFEEHMIVHCGTKLYSIGKDGRITKLLSDLPDFHSIPVEFSGVLYIYCNTYIFSVDRKFKAEEKMPYAPLYKQNVHRASGDSISTVVGFRKNMLAPFVSITYNYLYDEYTGGGAAYCFPKDFNKSRKFEIWFDSKKLEETQYTYNDDGFSLINLKQTSENTVMLRYYSTNEEFGTGEELAGCTVGTSFGGGTLEGTRVILSGNSEHPGKYYSSQLANGLNFVENSGGTIGAGTENITAFSKQYGYLLIFTENTVSRMNYNYTSENGGYYSVHTINNTLGCDVPESVAVIDNRTVFANSSGGVYIIDTLENYDLLNIVPISKNITDVSRKKGLSGIPETDLKKAVCCLYERKYMLLAKDKIFIWDYGQMPYSSSSDYTKVEKKMVWFEFEGISDAVSVMSVKSGLFVLKKTQENCLEMYMLGTSADKPDTTGYELCSKNMDMNAPHMKKVMKAFKLECKTDIETDVEVVFFADGVMYHSIKEHIIPDKDGYAVVSARLPKYILEHFSFCIKCSTPETGIFNIELDYMIIKSNLKR